MGGMEGEGWRDGGEGWRERDGRDGGRGMGGWREGWREGWRGEGRRRVEGGRVEMGGRILENRMKENERYYT
jgi:hypothetical protein